MYISKKGFVITFLHIVKQKMMGSLQFFMVFCGIQQIISVRVPCNQPLLRFTDNCNDDNAINWFQFEAGKKINFKKPLKAQCLKITEKVAFKIASEASYVYI